MNYIWLPHIIVEDMSQKGWCFEAFKKVMKHYFKKNGYQSYEKESYLNYVEHQNRQP